jgi:glycosidase
VNPNHDAINVASELKNPDSILNFYKNMIRVRKANPTLVYGEYALHLPLDEQLYVYTRTEGAEKWLVVANLSELPASFEAPKTLSYTDAELVIGTANVEAGTDVRAFALAPYEARLYRLN